MAALDFPSSPTDGQLHTQNGITWQYDGTSGVWVIQPEPDMPADLWNTSFDGATYTYTAEGKVDTVSESTADGIRDTAFAYATDGSVDTVTITHHGFGLQRVESFTYNADGQVTGVTTTETTI